jgi:3-methyl-2-oxobutanoate hydroxymethyltransferase
VHLLGGYKVQGKNKDAAALMLEQAQACAAAGAQLLVLEAIPSALGKKITEVVSIPTIGIGAGNETDGQILVWTDFAGLSGGKPRRFVREYMSLRADLLDAAKRYAADVESQNFPNQDESFSD